MKFIAKPNLVVRLHKPIGTTKYVIFNEKGEYETQNQTLQKKLLLHFSTQEHRCKYCKAQYSKKGDLLVHYRNEHKGVAK